MILRHPVQPTTLVEFANVVKIEEWNNLEMAADGRHPETHWKHEKPLPGCDCITRVTHELLTVVSSGI